MGQIRFQLEIIQNSKTNLNFLAEIKLEAPRSLYSSPGYNNNISQYNLITNVALVIADPFYNCCKKTCMSMVLKI
jgi:hypothetical protein